MVNFQDGTLVEPAKVTIDGVDHIVTPARWEGETPLGSYTLNKLQTDLQEEIKNISSSYDMRKQSSGSVSNTYALLAKYELTGNSVDMVDTILFSRIELLADSTMISIAIRKDANENHNITKSKYMSPKMNKIEFFTVSNYDSAHNTLTVELYTYNLQNNTILTGKSLSFKYNKNVTRTYYIDQPNLTALPSGTQYKISATKDVPIAKKQTTAFYYGDCWIDGETLHLSGDFRGNFSTGTNYTLCNIGYAPIVNSDDSRETSIRLPVVSNSGHTGLVEVDSSGNVKLNLLNGNGTATSVLVNISFRIKT